MNVDAWLLGLLVALGLTWGVCELIRVNRIANNLIRWIRTRSMLRFKDTQLMFPIDATDAEIERRFIEKFGHAPEHIRRDKDGAWAGPVTADEEQAARKARPAS